MELKKIIISPSNTKALDTLRELDKRKKVLFEKFEKAKLESKIDHNISDYYSNIIHNGRKYPLIKLTFSKN